MKRFFTNNLPIIMIVLLLAFLVGLIVFVLLLPGPSVPADLQGVNPYRYTMVATVLGAYVYRFLDGDTVCYLAVDHASGGVSIFCK